MIAPDIVALVTAAFWRDASVTEAVVAMRFATNAFVDVEFVVDAFVAKKFVDVALVDVEYTMTAFDAVRFDMNDTVDVAFVVVAFVDEECVAVKAPTDMSFAVSWAMFANVDVKVSIVPVIK